MSMCVHVCVYVYLCALTPAAIEAIYSGLYSKYVEDGYYKANQCTIYVHSFTYEELRTVTPKPPFQRYFGQEKSNFLYFFIKIYF